MRQDLMFKAHNHMFIGVCGAKLIGLTFILIQNVDCARGDFCPCSSFAAGRRANSGAAGPVGVGAVFCCT